MLVQKCLASGVLAANATNWSINNLAEEHLQSIARAVLRDRKLNYTNLHGSMKLSWPLTPHLRRFNDKEE